MKAENIKVLCIGVSAPREWSYEDRSGVSYKVEVTDGNGSIELPVTEDAYGNFESMQEYMIDLEIYQVNRNTQYGVRKTTVARIVDARLA